MQGLYIILKYFLIFGIYFFLIRAIHVLYIDGKRTLGCVLREGYAPLPLKKAPFYIGRDLKCDLILHDEYVSKIHAKIFIKEGRLWLEDLNSTNGTYINGEKLKKRVALKDGDLVKIGLTRFYFTK